MDAFRASGVGRVSSADIAVPEHGRESAFYSRVLSTGDTPLWRQDLLNNMGVPIIGLGERSPEHADLPLQWMPHIQVADVAASARRALERGGAELLHGKDDRGRSRWAVLLDPGGAAFGIIPVVASEAAAPADAGRIAWLDLTASDAPTIRDFYRAVVGWSVTEVEMEDGQGRYSDYAMCMADGTVVAGVCHARGVNRDLPPVWLIYLPVGDLAASLARVREGGGEILQSRTGDGGGHTYAVVRDPVGVCVGLVPD